MQQQVAQRSTLRQQQKAVSVAPAFSQRTFPHSFKPHCKSLTSSRTPTAAFRRHESRAAVRPPQAVARPSVFFFNFGGDEEDDYEEEYTVLKVQVGLFGDVARWQRELERLSELFDTEEEEGLHYILQETVTKLLRNLEYCSYGATAGKVFGDLDAAERKFNQVSLEERSKFKEETYSNVDGRRRRRSMELTPNPDAGLDCWLVATLVVAVEGRLVLPRVSSSAELRKALTQLGSVGADSLLAFELLWTPQAEGDSYSK
ncbi:hypothetical protein Agub_g6171, partial [Astrephomene gubernaculifera]